MKTLLVIFASFCITSLYAGEFSKIDYEVRETIIENFDVDFDGNDLNQMDYDSDIWNLQISSEKSSSCLIEVIANFNKPGNGGPISSIAWVCINKDQNGEFEGELLDHDTI